jgi:hypothetical protein
MVLEVATVFTIRNIGGVALFLFGTTYLWLTPMFAGKGVSTRGVLWSITQVLAFAALLGFTIATWGLFKRSSWWDGLAITSAIVGLVVLIPYWIAAHNSGEATPWFNVLIHAIGAVGVLVLLIVPTLASWVDGHVMAGK